MEHVHVRAKEKAPEIVPVLRSFEVDRKSDAIIIEGSVPASLVRELMAKTIELASK